MNQEDFEFLFWQYDLAEAAVVDASSRLVSVITVDDVVMFFRKNMTKVS